MFKGDTKLFRSLLSKCTARTTMLIVMLAGFAIFELRWLPGIGDSTAAPAKTGAAAVPVDIAAAKRKDVPVYLDGLGTVQAFYTDTITARVDGQLQSVDFKEGQIVKQGEVLAQIDPRPFRAAFDQATAIKAKDAAQLASAKRDLDRYAILAPEDLTSKQTIDQQRGLVEQLEAQVKVDQAMVEAASTQLAYTTIVSPIQGRTGIRRIDPGNIVRASDTGGIVIVTQLQPISCIFTLPEEAVVALNNALSSGSVSIAAMSRDGKIELDRGTVTLVDNQIDQSTGMIRLKANFPNAHSQLWPGEFINARVLVRTEHNALTIPSVAVQRGPAGLFAYVIKPDSTVEARPVTVALESNATSIIASGIAEGEHVVTSNHYRLQPGALIRGRTEKKKGSSTSPAATKGKAAEDS